MAFLPLLFTVGGWVLQAARGLSTLFTGGSLDSILSTINRQMSDDVEKEKIKAEVTKTWIDKQVQLLVGRTWWFQLFFVIPLGVWWTSVIYDCIFHNHVTYALPAPLDSWAGWIISALFVVDGGKALLGRFGK